MVELLEHAALEKDTIAEGEPSPQKGCAEPHLVVSGGSIAKRRAAKDLRVRSRMELLDGDANSRKRKMNEISPGDDTVNVGRDIVNSVVAASNVVVEKSAYAKVKDTLRLFNKHYLHFVQEEEKRCCKEKHDKDSKDSKLKKGESNDEKIKTKVMRPDLKAITKCPLLNISYCPASEATLSDGKSLVVIVYNPLGWKREEVIRIPVSTDSIVVQDSTGKEIEYQLLVLPLSNATLNLRNRYVKAYLGTSLRTALKYWLAFSASVPPLGFNTCIVSLAKRTTGSSISTVYTSDESTNGTIEVGQGSLRLIYSADEGNVNSRNQVTAISEQSYSYYSGNDGTDKDPQASGAYVFRPNGTFSIKSECQVPLTVIRGQILDEVHQQLNSWISQVTRVYKGKEHAEVEFTIGPIPADDGIGKEITTQIKTTMKTNKTFYTDSNGRDFIKRIRDFRTDWDLEVNQRIAGNYYPINLGIYMEDDNTELSVLVDRSVGGTSLEDGHVELMLHRRLLHDDARGVGETLNETVCVADGCEGLTIQGKFYLRIDPLGGGAKWRRTLGQEIYSPLLLAFSEQDGNNWVDSHVPTFSAIDPSYALPNNIAIITLQELENGKVLIRLAHLYVVGEDKDYSVMTKVELKKLFPNKKISKVTEMSLSGNQERVEMEKKRLVWKVEGSKEEHKVARGGPVDPVKLVVELAPMEICIFLIDFNYIQMLSSSTTSERGLARHQ